MPTIDLPWARTFADEWIAAWNSHDLDRVLSHYSDDFTMASPYIAEIAGEASGILRGKPAVRAYWQRALVAQPPIRFELIDVYAGVDSIVIHYRSVGRKLVTEVLGFDDAGRCVRGSACYGRAAQ